MGKVFVKGFGFIDENDDLVPKKKIAIKKVDDLPSSGHTKKRNANVERVGKQRKSK